MSNVQIKQVPLSQGQKIVHDYIYSYEKVRAFYPYAPYDQTSYEKRLTWLKDHPVSHREELVEGLLSFNREIGNHTKALENIEKLRQNDTFVVVAGQQAGVLTGPLYTIHKAITIIRLAEEQERSLGVHVVPVFWIAGEDHDYDEVNHVYVQTREADVRKMKLETQAAGKLSISHMEIPYEEIHALVEAFFAEQIETEFSTGLKEKLLMFADQSRTLTDFFARTFAWLFGEQGLILVDSALPFVRRLEKPMFARVIEQNREVNHAVATQGEKIESLGYHRQVETDADNAQFFLYRNQERVGVIRKADHTFQTRDGSETYTKEELLALLESEPERFSANVVTRPLMQEHLFPTLAFVGGPGEIAYWGLYNEMFTVMDMEMPPLVPRLTFSLFEGAVQRSMRKFEMSVEDVLQKLEEKRAQFLEAQDTFQLEEKFARAREQIKAIYDPLIRDAAEIERGLRQLGEKNAEKVLEQVAYYEKKVQAAFIKQHDAALRQFDRIKGALFPLDKPQERVYNIFGYLNKYGMEWFREFRTYPYVITSEHYAILID
jgi:bacillithiol biosynthesis cysteine-adding enzyme BshC